MPFFISPPPSAKANKSGEVKGRPYTAMYIAGIGMGFTTMDLRSMPPCRLMWFIHQNNLNNGAPDPEEGKGYRDGTIAELKKIL